VQSEWAELFIRYNNFWGGEPSEEHLAMIYTRKPRPPFREVEHGDGTSQKVRPSILCLEVCSLMMFGPAFPRGRARRRHLAKGELAAMRFPSLPVVVLAAVQTMLRLHAWLRRGYIGN
jgi:hypothetical protein